MLQGGTMSYNLARVLLLSPVRPILQGCSFLILAIVPERGELR